MQTNFLVVGSGIAGLTTALFLAERGEVVVATKKNLLESSSRFAQAGVAAVRNFERDSFDEHFADTLTAGAGANKKSAVKFLVENAPRMLDWLEREVGMKFRDEPTREAAHSHSRVWNTNDSTGETIEKALAKKVRAHPRIRILEKTELLDLILRGGICRGGWMRIGGKIAPIFAGKVVLATGGFGQLFAKSTNPEVSVGDGIAVAARAGAKLRELEFVQFHPTALVGEKTRLTLLSESLRGEGAVLRDSRGKRFVDELAPRDVVARAIFAEMKNKKDCPGRRAGVFLDFTRANAKFLANRFPLIWREVEKAGFNLAKDLIPIFPVAHYSCGGVEVNLRGETSVPSLLAVGEVARTGLHGANRLASNSLAEALVFGKSAAKNAEVVESKILKLRPPKFIFDKKEDREILGKIREILWTKVGIVRTRKGLAAAVDFLGKLEPKSHRARNATLVAQLLARSAKKRRKSLGTHFLAEEKNMI